MKESSSQTARELVAQADRRRRGRAADRVLARLAPFVAGALLGLAFVGRFAGWNRWVGVVGLAITAVALGVITLVQRRSRPTTDAIAAAIDNEASLRGELRSAHWFETTPFDVAQGA